MDLNNRLLSTFKDFINDISEINNDIGETTKEYYKEILELGNAYKKIFSSDNLHENVDKINGEYKGNNLVEEVTRFILKDKKRPICSPLNKE